MESHILGDEEKVYINGVNYISNPCTNYEIRRYLQQFYNQSTVGDLANMISEKIPCLDTSYSLDSGTITLTIKKSSVRKSAKSEIFNSLHYYSIVSDVYERFLSKHPEIVAGVLGHFGSITTNLFDIQCLGDKTVIIFI